MSTPFDPWEDLLERLRNGEDRAWETLVERTAPTFMETAQPITRSRPLAEDVLQDTWEALWRSRAEKAASTADPASFVSDLTRTVRGLAWMRAEREGRGRVVAHGLEALSSTLPGGPTANQPLAARIDPLWAEDTDPTTDLPEESIALDDIPADPTIAGAPEAVICRMCIVHAVPAVDAAAYLGLSQAVVEEHLQASGRNAAPKGGTGFSHAPDVGHVRDLVRRWNGEKGATYRLVRTLEPETMPPLKVDVRYEPPGNYTLRPFGGGGAAVKTVGSGSSTPDDDDRKVSGDEAPSWQGPFGPVWSHLAERVFRPGLLPLGEERTAHGVRLHVLSAPLGAVPAFVHLWLDAEEGLPSRVEIWNEQGQRTLRALVTEAAWQDPRARDDCPQR